MQSKSSKSLELVEQVLAELQTRKPRSLSSAIRKLELVAELLDDNQLRGWCQFNLGHGRQFLPRFEEGKEVKTYLQALTAKMRELKLEGSVNEILVRLDPAGGGFESIEFIEDRYEQLKKEKKGNDGTFYLTNLAVTITEAANAASTRTAKLYSTLAFGDIPRQHLDAIRDRVDRLLLDLCPEAVEQFMKAYERLAAGGTEDWSLALTACRRVIKAVADAIFPPRDGEVSGRKVGDAQYINRLWAFLDEHLPASSDKDLAKAHVDYLGSFIQRLNEKASKGVHAKVTHDEAVRSVLYTYLTLGDLLELAPKGTKVRLVGESKLDVNSATLEQLSNIPSLPRAVAKEIIIRRAKSPFKALEELLQLKGIGPKGLEKLRGHLAVLPPGGKNGGL